MYHSQLIIPTVFCLPDCWLEVSAHARSFATGHRDTGFLGSPVFKQMLRWFSSSQLLLRNLMQIFGFEYIKTWQAIPELKYHTRKPEILSSNLGRKTGYTEIRHGFSQPFT
jgi:hypothetical protein